jgi:protein O-mannosyl-transferase
MPASPAVLLGRPVKDWWLVAAVTIVTAAVFWPSVGYGFVNFDDDEYVYQNNMVLGGLSSDAIWWALTTRHATNWHPLTWLSLQLDATLFGKDAIGFHRTNVLIHAVTAGLTYLVFRRMTGAVGRSLSLALLFALHPLRVESVTWVAERKDVLSTLFWVLTLLAYHRYVTAPSRGRMAVVAVVFALGLMAKPMLVTLPFVLMLLDFWPFGRWQRLADVGKLVREKVVLFVLVIGSCVVTVYVQGSGGAVQTFDQVPTVDRLAGAPVAYVVYLGMTAWPSELSVYYPLPREARPLWQPVAAVAVVASITVFCFFLRRRATYALVGWLWYLGTLVPVIGILQVGGQAYADRYTYVPHLGLWLAVVWAVAGASAHFRLPEVGQAALAVLAVAACGALTVRQERFWSSPSDLWERSLAVTPDDNPIANYNYAIHLLKEGREEDSAVYLRRAADAVNPINPIRAWSLVNLAKVALHAGKTADAEWAAREVFAAPTASPSDRSLAEFTLGELHRRRGELKQAESHFREAVRTSEDYAPRLFLGLLLGETGRKDEGFGHLAEAHRFAPDVPECNHALGLALGDKNDWSTALPYLERAVKNRPTDGRFHGSLAMAWLETGQPEKARQEALEAARHDPDWVERTRAAAWALATSPDPAAREGKKALRMASVALLGSDPTGALLDTLAAAAAESGKYDEAVRFADRAAQLAANSGQSSLADAIRGRAALYRNKQPYRATGS